MNSEEKIETLTDFMIVLGIEIGSMALVCVVSLAAMYLLALIWVISGQAMPDVVAPEYVVNAARGYYVLWTTFKVPAWLFAIVNLSVYAIISTIPNEQEASDIIGGKYR